MAPDVGWRLSLGLAAVPALFFFFGTLLLPDSPNSLLQRGHEAEGRKVLLQGLLCMTPPAQAASVYGHLCAWALLTAGGRQGRLRS